VWNEYISIRLRVIYRQFYLMIVLILPFEVHGSLFFTEKEVQHIHQNFLLKNKRVQNRENLYLSAIVYVDEDHWTLWVNQQPIHASDPQQLHGFHIEKVTPLTATFSWHPPQESVPLRFTLRSQDIFLGNEKKVIKFLKINEK
jgi:hypothetical protein